MYCAGTNLIRQMEKESVAGGVPEYELMRRAGIQAARWINDRFPDAARVVILCGGGNNGGDALVAAAYLRHREVIIYSTKEKSAFSGCAACAVRDLPEKIPFIVRKTLSEADFFSGDIIVDGLLGIGFCGKELRSDVQSFIKAANSSNLPVISLDLPSGINADTGEAAVNGAVRAHTTLTFGRPKSGLFTGDGAQLRGGLRILDIGLTDVAGTAGREIFSNFEAEKIVPRHRLDVHKNSRGKVAVWAGSAKYPGAAVLCSHGALKAGAGMVRCASEADLSSRLCQAVIFEQLSPGGIPEDIFSVSDVLVCGCGWGNTGSVAALRAVLDFPGKVVLDADALNFIAGHPEVWQKRNDVIITPHPKEAERLLLGFGMALSESRIKNAVMLASETGAVTLLKGRDTVVASPDGRAVTIAAGNPLLATAGSGDVLAGVIGAQAAQGLSAVDAAMLGAYVHDIAAERADGILTADEMPGIISHIMVKLQNNRII